jgi:argininosuccinate lyase
MADNKPSSTQPIWSKRVGDAAVAAANVAFCAGYDVQARPEADVRLAPFDLMTNAAHLQMLVAQGIVPAEAGRAAAKALLELKDRQEAGENFLRPGCEDIHMSTEALVTEIAGAEAGGRLHTARSRNDQVATDMRLWMREEVATHSEAVAFLADAIAEHARSHVNTVCPGFTHGQPAMVTSWGHWTMSYLPRLLRDLRAITASLEDVKSCPLGAAASFGTSWPIDREMTCKLLGFERPTESGADGIWCRGELEGRFAFALAQFMAHLGGISQDLITLTTPPRDWLRLANEHVTGSSIMPQKRNPDFAEVTRGRASVAAGITQSLLGIGSALPSGYNRDTQWTKYLVFDATDNAEGAAVLFADVFRRIEVNKESMKAACEIGFLNATDVADFLASSRGVPFRQCYRILGAAVRSCEEEGKLTQEKLNAALAEEKVEALSNDEWAPLEDPAGLLLARVQPGNPNPERTLESIDLIMADIQVLREKVHAQAAKWEASKTALWDGLRKLAEG